MEQSIISQQSLKNTTDIGNIVINYGKYDVPIDVIPIVMSDGTIKLLSNLHPNYGKNRLVIQDLAGNTIKTLLQFGFENSAITVDNDNIYVFTSNSRNPMYYVIDKKSLTLKFQKPLGRSCVQECCCDGENIFTFDMNNGEIQIRDKQGNVLSATSVRENHGDFSVVTSHNLYIASDGFHSAKLGALGIDEDYKSECEEKFGKEFMELNSDPWHSKVAYDEDTHTMFVSKQNIIYVANDEQVLGLMYFPDKYIWGLSVDPITKSLIICSLNRSEDKNSEDKTDGGSLEILPISMVQERIKSSESFLINKNKSKVLVEMCHRIVDGSNGDIKKMILLLQQLDESRTGNVPEIDSESHKR